MEFPDLDVDTQPKNAIAAAAAEAAGTEIALLPPKQRALIVLKSEQTEADLRALVARSKHVTEVKNPDGREQAHRMAMDLRNARTTITSTGKKAREDATAFSKAIIDEEKRLLAITAAEEERVFGLRDAFDAKLKEEAAEKARIEAERKAAIQARIDDIANLTTHSLEDSADDLAATIADLEGFEPSEEDFGEFVPVAMQAATVALTGLRALHTGAVARETMARQLAEQQRQLEAQQQALAEAQAKLAAQQAALAPAPEPEPEPAPAPAGWDQIEADDLPSGTHGEDGYQQRIDNPDATITQDPAPLTWETADERNLNEQIIEPAPAGFTDAGLARVAAAVAEPEVLPGSVWVLLEDGMLTGYVAASREEAAAERIRSANLNPAYSYHIARYVLAEEE
jgi:hypothetical protein